MSAAYTAGAEDPELHVRWLDDKGDPVDFETGYTFALKIYRTGKTPVLTKTAGMTGAPTLPNIVVVWAAGELDVASGGYELEIKATKAGRDRFLHSTIEIRSRAA